MHPSMFFILIETSFLYYLVSILTIYSLPEIWGLSKDHTDKPLADLHLNCHKIKKLTHKLNEYSIRHASALIKTRYALHAVACNITQATTVKDWVQVLRHTTPLTHINFFLFLRGGGLPGAGTKVTPSLNRAGCVITGLPAESFLF